MKVMDEDIDKSDAESEAESAKRAAKEARRFQRRKKILASDNNGAADLYDNSNQSDRSTHSTSTLNAIDLLHDSSSSSSEDFVQTETYREIQLAAVPSYEDVFTFEAVKADEILRLRFVSSLKQTLWQFTKKLKAVVAKKAHLLPLDVDPVEQALYEACLFCLDLEGVELPPGDIDALLQLDEFLGIEENQLVLHEQGIVEPLLDVLRAPFKHHREFKKCPCNTAEHRRLLKHRKWSKPMLRIVRLLFKLLTAMCAGNDAVAIAIAESQSEAYRFSDITFILSGMQLELAVGGATGLGVATLVEDLIDCNAELLSKIKEGTIRDFVQLLRRSGRESRYLKLLVALCSFNGKG